MRGYFIFNYESNNDKHIVVVYCASEKIKNDDLINCVKEYCDKRIPPDDIIIIAPNDQSNIISTIVNTRKFRQRLKSYTRYRSPSPIHLWFYRSNGEVIGNIDDQLVDEVKYRGMIDIFRKRNGMQESTSNYHYVKPSGVHCNKFIRTANALVNSAEVKFIAFCCLKYIGKYFKDNNIRHIYCDTSAIHSIGYAINHLRSRLIDEHYYATIDSFGSYDGINTFEFVHPRKSLILISASTSGGLQEEVRRKEPFITKTQIVTVFYHGNSPSGQVACNLIDNESERDGYPAVENYESDTCPLCQNASTAVRVTGDQFLVEPVEPKPVVVQAKHAPAWLSTFVRNYKGTDSIRANYSRNKSRRNRSIFFDVRKLLPDKSIDSSHRFGERLLNLLKRSLPLTLSRIIYMNDDSSKWMADAIKAFAIKKGIEDIDMVSLAEVERSINSHVMDTGSTVVVSSAVATGRSLLTASKVLRDVQQNGAISYLIGIARMSDRAKLKNLIGNVTYEDNPRDYPFSFVDAVFLPLDTSEDYDPWEEETVILDEMISKSEDHELIQNLKRRRNIITNASSREVRGLTNRLFLNDVYGEKLVLRPGFAFYNFPYEKGDINQVEVLFTIMSVLHNLRSIESDGMGTRRDVAERLLLDPISFERFNDGVIQAAILRAARHTELDYSIAPEKSKQMARILKVTLRNAKGEAGEAATEFLLALAMGKLQLREEDLRRLEEEEPLDNIDDKLVSALWMFAVERR